MQAAGIPNGVREVRTGGYGGPRHRTRCRQSSGRTAGTDDDDETVTAGSAVPAVRVAGRAQAETQDDRQTNRPALTADGAPRPPSNTQNLVMSRNKALTRAQQQNVRTD
jgi:hypothetical protein